MHGETVIPCFIGPVWRASVFAAESIRDVFGLRQPHSPISYPPWSRGSPSSRILPLRFGREDQPEAPEPQVAILPTDVLDRILQLDPPSSELSSGSVLARVLSGHPKPLTLRHLILRHEEGIEP